MSSPVRSVERGLLPLLVEGCPWRVLLPVQRERARVAQPPTTENGLYVAYTPPTRFMSPTLYAQRAPLTLRALMHRTHHQRRGESYEPEIYADACCPGRRRARRNRHARAARSSQAESLHCQRARNDRCRGQRGVRPGYHGCAKGCGRTESRYWGREDHCNARHGTTLRPSVRRRSRQYGGTSSKP